MRRRITKNWTVALVAAFLLFCAVILSPPFSLNKGGLGVVDAYAGTVSLPDTGQTKCYDTSGAEISCTGTGQDGDKGAGVDWPNPRFTVSGDCVTDNITGLMWTKDGNRFGKRTWTQAISNANNLSLCGFTDWRLPNVLELESLVHAGYNKETCGSSKCSSNAAWLNTQGFTNVQLGYYWSATTDADVTDVTWDVDMWDGSVGGYDKSDYYVWPVRGGQITAPAKLWKTQQTTSYAAGDDGDLKKGVSWPSPRFTDNGNGTVTDNLTGLIWLKNANCKDTAGGVSKGSGNLTWSNALTWSNNLANGNCGLNDGSHAGDWRLPNRKELLSLVDYSRYNPALPSGHPFTNVQSIRYWSATTGAYKTGNAWVGNMWSGSVYGGSKSASYYVWPVRGGR